MTTLEELVNIMTHNWGPIVGCNSVLDFNNDGYVNVSDVTIANSMSESECQSVIDSFNTCQGEAPAKPPSDTTFYIIMGVIIISGILLILKTFRK